jgi:nucleoside-diphosphate-sugar epimerase
MFGNGMRNSFAPFLSSVFGDMTKRIIVTGGLGFLGSAVSTALVERGWEVHTWDRVQPRSEALFVRGGIRHHRVVDIYDQQAVRAAMMETAASEMIHLAWGGLPNYMSCHHLDVELVNQIKFVRTAIECGIANLTQTGTCFEYGARSGALKEDMTCEPNNPYGFAKLALLRYVEFLRTELPFDYKWLRLFYMYGEGQSPTSLYSLLCAAYARGDKTFDMSLGHQLRDFSPVSEIVAKIVALHECEAADGVYNVCSGRPVSVRQLVESWAAELGYDVTLNLGKFPVPDYEPLAFWGSDTKTCQALGGHQGA